jgi:hypothetical protein
MYDTAMREVLKTQQSKFFGKYRGLVVQNQDILERRGRLRVVVPQVLGDTEVWAMPCVPYAGAGVGLFTLPPKDTPVWVEFEAGDPSYPIWTGCIWPSGDISITDLGVTSPNKFLKTDKFSLEIDELLGIVTLKLNQGEAKIEFSPIGITIKGTTVSVEDSAGGKIMIAAGGVIVNNGVLAIK